MSPPVTVINKTRTSAITNTGGRTITKNPTTSGSITVSSGRVMIKETRKTVTVAGKPDDPPSYGAPSIAEGTIIPYICGQQRSFNPVVTWYGNLTPEIEVKTELTSSEVEEIRTVEDYETERNFVTTNTITVTASIVGWKLDVQMALCLGPDVELLEIRNEDEVVWSGVAGTGKTEIKVKTKGLVDSLAFYSGQFDQPRDPDLVKWCGNDVPGYVGVAYVLLRGLNVTDSFPALTFEIRRRPNPLELSDDQNLIGNDINPLTAAYDWLVNDWGAVGMSPDLVDAQSFRNCALVVASERIGSSVFVSQKTSGTRVLKEYEQHIRGLIFYDPSSNKVKASLLRRDLTNAFVLTPDNVIGKPRMGKNAWQVLANTLPITYTNRKKDYEEGSFSLDLPIEDHIPKRFQEMTYPMAMTYGVAQLLAVRDAPYETQPSWDLSVTVTREAWDLSPGDVTKFNWPDYSLNGVIGTVIRREDDKKSGNISLSIAPLLSPFGGLLVDEELTKFQKIDPDPKAPQSFRAISAPYWIAYRAGYKYSIRKRIDFDLPIYAIQPANRLQRKADIYRSDDPLSPGEWKRIDQGISYGSTGRLAEAIGEFDSWENGVLPELKIKAVSNPQYLVGYGLQGVRQGQSFLVIGEEFMAFEGATQNGDGTWTLTNVHRALFGRPFGNHSVNAPVSAFGNDWATVGKPIKWDMADPVSPSLKAVSWGVKKAEDSVSGGKSLDNPWETSNQLNRPYRPDNTKVNGVRSSVPTEVEQGGSFDVEYSRRHRGMLQQVALIEDPSDPPEVYSATGTIAEAIFFEDANGVDHLLLTETSSDPAFPLSCVMPSGAALGVGYLKVVSYLNGNSSLWSDRVPIEVVATSP